VLLLLQNDMFTMSTRQAKNSQVRLAIAYALAQSIKLSVYEGRVWGLVSISSFGCRGLFSGKEPFPVTSNVYPCCSRGGVEEKILCR
jgi:hypothetical protein